MRNALNVALASLLLLSACGGGGGGSSSVGCGGGGGGGGGGAQVIAKPGPPNVEPLIMDGGPANALNTAFVTVTVCAPGTSTCQTIEHIEGDTASSGPPPLPGDRPHRGGIRFFRAAPAEFGTHHHASSGHPGRHAGCGVSAVRR